MVSDKESVSGILVAIEDDGPEVAGTPSVWVSASVVTATSVIVEWLTVLVLGAADVSFDVVKAVVRGLDEDEVVTGWVFA